MATINGSRVIKKLQGEGKVKITKKPVQRMRPKGCMSRKLNFKSADVNLVQYGIQCHIGGRGQMSRSPTLGL